MFFYDRIHVITNVLQKEIQWIILFFPKKIPLIKKSMVSTTDFYKQFREGTNTPDNWNGLLSFILLRNKISIGVPLKFTKKTNQFLEPSVSKCTG